MSIWDTEGLIDRLIAIWNAGTSGGDTAKELTQEFRVSITRNMVIAKVDRLRASGRIKGGLRSSQSSRKRRKKRTGIAAQNAAAKKAVAPKRAMSGLFLGGGGDLPPVEPLPKEDVRPDHVIPLRDVSPRGCQWIYGDPKEHDAGFCPSMAVLGTSWCAHHARRAYRPPEPVRRAPRPERIPTMADLEKV